jgi:hypothetical protein
VLSGIEIRNDQMRKHGSVLRGIVGGRKRLEQRETSKRNIF